MKVTREMLQASTQAAVQLGVLPRQTYVEDLATNFEIMQEILQAALDPIPSASGDARHGSERN